jgi:gliding motility-associated-like protein
MRELKKHFFTACFILLGYALFAQQNLISNGGFETYSLCPTQLSNTSQQLALATGWLIPTSGTPDYFNSCAITANNVDIPQNTYGYQAAHTGNAYAGFYAYTNPVQPLDNIREYMQVQLTVPLIAGKTYYFKMYVNLANSLLFRKSVSNIGAYFSNTAINKLDNAPFTVIPQVQSSTFISDTLNWTEISGSFIASGGERFVTIGRFGTDNVLSTKPLPGDVSANSAYYYIDDISLIDSCYQFNVLSNILGPDSNYSCVDKPMQLSLSVQNAITTAYFWSTNQTTPSIAVSTPGTYWVKMSDGKCFVYDTVNILAKTKPRFTLGNDTAACFNSVLVLKPTITSDTSLPYAYRWLKRVGSTLFELGNNKQFSINYPDRIMLELSVNGCKQLDSIDIHASVLKQVHLPMDTAICRNTKILLTGQTSGALSYKWSSGETTAAIQTKSKFSYWVNAMDSFCLSSDTIQCPANNLRDTLVCGQQTIELKGDPLASNHLWSSGARTNFLPVTTGGTYYVSQQKDGCTVVDTVHIIMDSIPYSNLGSDTFICVDPVYELKANAPLALTYLWDSGDTLSSIILQKSGKYAVTTSNKNCSYRDSVLIQTLINTPFSFGEDQADCFSEPIILNPKLKGNDKLLWSNGSVGKSLTVTQPGVYWLKVVSGVCVNYDTITFYAKEHPSVDLGNDTVLCIGNKLILDAQDSGFSYIWNTGADSRIIEVEETGYYFVEKRTIEGCLAVDTVDVKFVKGFELFKKHSWNVCEDSSTIIIPTQKLTDYVWSDFSTLSTLRVNEPGAYWLRATDSIGCVVTDTIMVDQHVTPQITLDSVIFTCSFPQEITPVELFTSYLWSGGTNGRTKEITVFGKVSLTVTDSIGCKAKATVEVINNCPAGVTITNVFTPNNDGLNDVIIPQYEHIKTTHFLILNRWGNKVFESADIEKGWDGTLPGGQEAPAGTYYFTIECAGIFDEPFTKQGTITLIR